MKTMRKLKFSDLGGASKIIKKLELRIENGKTSMEEMGASLFLKLLENYHYVEKEIAEFMSKMIEDMTVEEFLNLSMLEVMEYFELLKQDEGLSAFLQILSKYMKSPEMETKTKV